MTELFFETSKEQELLDITHEVSEVVKKSSIKNGLCNVFVPHATAAIIINENADPKVCDDIINKLDKLIPLRDNYIHDRIDGNAHSHIKAAILGPSETIPIIDGKLILGTWQAIMLCDFDGPRRRKVMITLSQ
jgi:secondary thiamine-phosphate synthase enzyme